MQPVRWGIIGTGHIARKFAADLTAMPEARLVAVGSRSTAAAESFGALWGTPRRHGSYAALAQDPEVEAVYVAVPHPFHAENCLLCLEAGKAVLCEKPFAINAAQAAEVIGRARAGKRLMMEGMWTRAFPLMARLRELLAEGAVGRVRLVAAEFQFPVQVFPGRAAFQPRPGRRRVVGCGRLSGVPGLHDPGAAGADVQRSGDRRDGGGLSDGDDIPLPRRRGGGAVRRFGGGTANVRRRFLAKAGPSSSRTAGGNRGG